MSKFAHVSNVDELLFESTRGGKKIEPQRLHFEE
jgi:hypothetical protein